MTWLNDNPYLRERDELLAHLVDDGTLALCADPRCGEPVDDACEFCGKALCAGGIFMHHIIGCTLASRAEAQEGGGDGE